MEKFLVTGVAGFIGYHFARELLQKGEVVVGVDNFCNSKESKDFNSLLQFKNFSFFNLDLKESEKYSELPSDITRIVHFAAINGTNNFYTKPIDVIESCILPTLNLLKFATSLNSLRKFFLASTGEVYAGVYEFANFMFPTDENIPLAISNIFNPRWSYAAGKIAAEVITTSFLSEYEVPIVIGRIHNAYGPRMGSSHVIPDFLERVATGNYSLYGADNTRSFIFIDDLVQAIKNLVMSLDGIGVYNLGSSKEVTIRELAENILKILKIESEITEFTAPIGSAERRMPDISKYEKKFGKLEFTPIEEGLIKTIVWYQAN
jgi:UDP-glucose 4-epimerase